MAKIPRHLVFVMAVATGLAVANNYYAQPLLPVIARDLALSAKMAGLIVTCAQAGYAIGLVVLVPTGDVVERRRLLTGMGIATAAALAWVALAPSASLLLPAAFVVGILSVQAQTLVPFAATLAHEEERGRVVGTVMSGLLLGILLARTVAGYIAELFAWRAVYFGAAAAMLAQAVVLWATLPRSQPKTALRYLELLASVWRLLRDEPVLRLRTAYGALAFGAFSVFWTSVAFLLAGPPYHYSTGRIGLLGLVGAAGAVSASGAGRLADRGLAQPVTRSTAFWLAASWLPIALGARSLLWLLIGVVVLDLAVQGLHITNQSEIYRLRPDARSRVTSAYMSLYFVGGAVGSSASAAAFSAAGWSGVSALGGAFGVVAFVLSIFARSPAARRRSGTSNNVSATRRGSGSSGPAS